MGANTKFEFARRDMLRCCRLQAGETGAEVGGTTETEEGVEGICSELGYPGDTGREEGWNSGADMKVGVEGKESIEGAVCMACS